MNIPEGELVRSRVVDDPGPALATALDRGLTGYAVLAPQETLLLDEGAHGMLALEDGVPVAAHHPGTDRGGPAALADLAGPGPYRCDLYELPADALPRDDGCRVPPGLPAERLAGNPTLAERTREAAPADRTARRDASALEAFLEDEERVRAIKREARREARERAAEWGLEDQLVDPPDE
jgi:hypothetical protein